MIWKALWLIEEMGRMRRTRHRARPVIPSPLVTKDEALRLAQSLVDYRANMVEDAKRLAHYVLDGGETNGFLVAQARVTELEGQVRTLGSVIDRVAAADPDSRDQAIAAAVTARRACQ